MEAITGAEVNFDSLLEGAKAGLVHGDKFGFDIEKMPAPTTRGCVRLDINYSHGDVKRSVMDIVPVVLLN